MTQHMLPVPPRQTFFQRYLGATWQRILAAILFLAAFVPVFDWTHSVVEATSPEIHSAGSNPSAPFSVPFSIKNPSAWFAMREVQWVCAIDRVEGVSGGIATGGTITISTNALIEPGETKNFICPIGVDVGILPGIGPLKTGRVAISIKYKTVWLPRESTPVPMTWMPNANPPHWIEGGIIHM